MQIRPIFEPGPKLWVGVGLMENCKGERVRFFHFSLICVNHNSQGIPKNINFQPKSEKLNHFSFEWLKISQPSFNTPRPTGYKTLPWLIRSSGKFERGFESHSLILTIFEVLNIKVRQFTPQVFWRLFLTCCLDSFSYIECFVLLISSSIKLVKILSIWF